MFTIAVDYSVRRFFVILVGAIGQICSVVSPSQSPPVGRNIRSDENRLRVSATTIRYAAGWYHYQ